MKKSSKILYTGLSLFIFLSVATFYFVQSFLQPVHLKNIIQQQFRDTAGRNLSIQGDIKWHLFPWVGLDLSEVEISNPAPFSDKKTFAIIKKLGVTLKLVSLLQGKYDVGNLYVKDAKLNLYKNPKGEVNWLFNSVEASHPSKNDQNKLQFHIQHINIDNGDIAFTDQQHNQNWRLANINFNAKEIEQNVYFPLQFSFKIFNQSKVAINVKSTAQVMINLDEKSVALKQIDAVIGETQLQGNLSYLHNHAVPQLNFKMVADHINSAFYDTFLLDQPPQVTASLPSDAVTTPVPFALEGKIHIKQLQHNNLVLSDIDLNPQMKQGVFNITQLTAKLYQGYIKAKLYGNMTEAIPRWNAELDLNNINLNGFSQNNKNNKDLRLNGILNLDARLNTQGWQLSSVLTKLGGTLRGNIDRGEIIGFSLKKQLEAAKILAAGQLQTSAKTQAGTTAEGLSKLTGSMTIINGVGTTRDLTIINSLTEITSQGYFNFINNSFDFSIHSKVTTNNNSRLNSLQKRLGGNIPLRAKGDINNYKIYADTKGMIRAGMEKMLQEKIQDILSLH